jgi:hypothetical protein
MHGFYKSGRELKLMLEIGGLVGSHSLARSGFVSVMLGRWL